MSPDLLRPFLPALALALTATLFGHGLGVAFGVAEGGLKGSLQAGADAALVEVYGGDAAKAQAVVDKSWAYLKRAHLHAGALGTGALALTLVLAFLGGPLRARQATAFVSALGACGYGLFWLVAGLAAPRLGGTGAAKEAYAFLGLPAAALIVAGTVGGLLLVVRAAIRPIDRGSPAP
jgi:hypothetical protein